MLNELLGIALGTSERRPLGFRTALRIAMVALLCTVLAASVLLLMGSLGVWLAGVVGRASALALTGTAGLLVAVVGLLVLGGRRRARRETAASVEAGGPAIDLFARFTIQSLTRDYPLEAMTLAAAAGVFVAGSEGAGLARPLLDVVLRSIETGQGQTPESASVLSNATK